MGGGVWYLRIWPGIKHSFAYRYVEWIMGLLMLFWGLKLLEPGDNFATASGAWSGLAAWAPDYVWGAITSVVGVIRLAALGINGTFRDTFYAGYSPLVRGGTAFLCCLVWVAVTISVAASSSQGVVVYFALMVLEGLTAHFVAGESGDTLRVYRNGRKSR